MSESSPSTEVTVYRSGARLNLDDDRSSIQQLRTGTGAHILLANGFLSQSVTGWDHWKRPVTERYPGHPVSRVRWEAQVLESLKPLVAALDTGGDANRLLAHVRGRFDSAFTAIKEGRRPDLPAAALLLEAPAKWLLAKQRATETGQALAKAISETDDDAKFILMGFSLGARVMAATAMALAEAELTHKVSAIHLIGGAIGRSSKWQPITDVVTDGVWNYYSGNDSVLSMLYRTAEIGEVPIGLSGMQLEGPKAHDINVTAEVFTHRGYLPVISLK